MALPTAGNHTKGASDARFFGLLSMSGSNSGVTNGTQGLASSCSLQPCPLSAQLAMGALLAERHRLVVVVEEGAPAGRVQLALAAALGARERSLDRWCAPFEHYDPGGVRGGVTCAKTRRRQGASRPGSRAAPPSEPGRGTRPRRQHQRPRARSSSRTNPRPARPRGCRRPAEWRCRRRPGHRRRLSASISACARSGRTSRRGDYRARRTFSAGEVLGAARSRRRPMRGK
jgi:hypothetical protein